MKSRIFRLLVVVLLVASAPFVWASSSLRYANVVTVDGGIGPATADYVTSAISRANAAQDAAVIVLRLNTPGGLGSSMRRIIQSILSSDVPVVSYVSPSGARAASAGTFILYASPIAAMAPGTNVGAAAPVSMMAGAGKGQPNGASLDKVKNDAKAYIKSLAELHGRNVVWAMKSVSASASISAKQALKNGVIDRIALNLTDLIQKIDGATVMVNGKKVVLATRHLQYRFVDPNWREQFLMIITQPSIAYLLFMGALFCLAVEFLHPGLMIPGVLGAIGLFLALYSLQMLPVSYVGLALIFLGIAFIILEFFVTAFGVFGVGGVISLLVGSIMLFPSDMPGFGISPHLVYGVPLILGAILLTLVYVIVRDRRRLPISNMDSLVGKEGQVVLMSDNLWLKCRGDLLRIDNPEGLQEGNEVFVERMDGARVVVKKTP